jgi:hypothetical protein
MEMGDPALVYVLHETQIAAATGDIALHFGVPQNAQCGALTNYLFGARMRLGNLNPTTGEFTGELVTRGGISGLSGRVGSAGIEIVGSYDPSDGRGARLLTMLLSTGSDLALRGELQGEWAISCPVSVHIM